MWCHCEPPCPLVIEKVDFAVTGEDPNTEDAIGIPSVTKADQVVLEETDATLKDYTDVYEAHEGADAGLAEAADPSQPHSIVPQANNKPKRQSDCSSSSSEEMPWPKPGFAVRPRRRENPNTAWAKCLELVPGLVMAVTLVLTMTLAIYPVAWHKAQGITSCDASVEQFLRGVSLEPDEVTGLKVMARWRFAVLTLGTFVCWLLVAIAVEQKVWGSLHVAQTERCLLMNWVCCGTFGAYHACDWCSAPERSEWRGWCSMWWIGARVLFVLATLGLTRMLYDRVHALQTSSTWDLERVARYSRVLVRVCMGFAVVLAVCSPVLYIINHVFDLQAADASLLILGLGPVIGADASCACVAVLFFRSLLHPLECARKAAAQADPAKEAFEKDCAWFMVHQTLFEMLSALFCLATCIGNILVSFRQMFDLEARPRAYTPLFLLLKDCATPIHLLANGILLMALSGILELPRWSNRQSHPAEDPFEFDPSISELVGFAEWDEKVDELCGRGFTLEALLDFYQMLGTIVMPHFDPAKHTTGDVVRLAIIPLTAHGAACTGGGPCAMASLMMRGEYTPASFVVTHNWHNHFADLVSAIVASALGMRSYHSVMTALTTNPDAVKAMLKDSGMLSSTWWVCAFSVNQHTTICHTNDSFERDPITGLVHPICVCGRERVTAKIRPTDSEVNKFPWLLEKGAEKSHGFTHVVVVDADFELFQRTWCAFEMVTGKQRRIPQRLIVHSARGLDQRVEALSDLRLQDMEASRPEDVRMIYDLIEDLGEFDLQLRSAIFDGKDGLLPEWESRQASSAAASSSLAKVAQLGRSSLNGSRRP